MNAHGVLITNGSKSQHTYTNWKMWMESFPVMEAPSAQTNTVQVPGMDGVLDLTESVDGYIHYNTRSCTIDMDYLGVIEEWPSLYSKIMEMVHGQVCQIYLDSDPGWYYKGRCTVSPAYGMADMHVEINMTAEPYKRCRYQSDNDNWLWDYLDLEHGTINEHFSNIEVSGSTVSMTLAGTPMPTYPVFVVSSVTDSLTFTYGSTSLKVTSVGTYEATDMIIPNEAVTITAKGTGKFTLKYRGGRL